MFRLKQLAVGKRDAHGWALIRGLALMMVLVLLASADDGASGPMSAWYERQHRKVHGPKQTWGSADSGAVVAQGSRNRHTPRSLRARYPLTSLKPAGRPQQNEASVGTPLAAHARISGFDEKRSREIPGARDAHLRTFTNPDGTQSTEFSPEPINYRRPDGRWAPIDTRVEPVGEVRHSRRGDRPSGGWRNKADAVDVRLAPSTGGGPIVRVGLDAAHEVAYSLHNGVAAAGRAHRRGVTYPGVQTDTDLKIDMVPGGVKETIVLRSHEAPNTFDFPLALKGLTPRLDGGRIAFVDSGGRTRAVVPAGFMTDSAVRPATSTKVAYSLVTVGGAPALRVSADPAWLADPARKFPVMVDPSVEISPASTSMTVTASGSVGGGQELTIGSKSAAYLAFPQLDDKLKYHRIFGAHLWMVNYDSATCRSRPVSVHPATQAWAGQSGLSYPGPSVGRALSRSSFSHGHIAFGATKSKCPTKAVAFDLGKGGRDLVQKWVNGQQPNYGLSVRDASDDELGYKKFTGDNTVNPPRLIVTHSRYNASYAFTNPVPNPPVTQAQSGKVQISVTNWGAETWTPGGYYLAYRIFDDKGKLLSQQRSANLPGNVARGAKVRLQAEIKPLKPSQHPYSLDFTMVRTGGPVFIDEQVPPARLILKVIDIAPVLQELYPFNGYQAPTLTPQLWARAVDLDAPPGSALSFKFEVCQRAPDGSPTSCFDSGYLPAHAWTIPAGKLSWSKTYLWRAFVKDTATEIPSPRVMLQTSVPQPEITSRLSEAGERGFDPQVGNYSASAVDASVASVGPPLSIERTYNSLDPRRDMPFGAGWTTQFDMRLAEDQDGSGNVVVGYPDGQQVRYGRNADGSFAPPPGRQATLTLDAGQGRLTDKAGNVFDFVNGRLTRIADAAGHSITLTYNATNGKLAKATAVGGRALTFTWSGNHVASVSTPVVDGKSLTWSYTYDGDRLTKVCAPGSRCTTYGHSVGSHYRSAVMDSRPESYWRLAEEEGDNATSQVAVNLGRDAGSYKNVTMGTAGALSGTEDTAATFNGSSSQVTLPPGTVKKSRDLAVEVWFKNLSTGPGGPLLGYQDKALDGTSGLGVPVLYTGTDGKLRGQFHSGGTISPITSSVAVNDGKWHHAVLSAMGSTQTLYLDGKAVGSLTDQTPNPLNLTHNQIGAAYATTPASWPGWGSNSRRFFSGTIDEVALYHHPLGPAQVATHYREAVTAANQVSQIALPSGKVAAEVEYDTAADRVKEYTDQNGGTWRLQTPTVYGGEDDLRRAVELRDPAGRPYLYEQDALTGQTLRVGIPRGLDVREEDQGPPTSPPPTPSPTYNCTEPDPGDPSFCTTLPGRPGEEPDFIGHTIDGMGIRTFEHDDRGFPTQIVNENGDAVRFKHDDRGNLTARTTCRTKDVCHTAYYTYPAVTDPADPRNDLPIEYRDGRSSGPADNRYKVGYTYTSAGNLFTQTDPEGGGELKYTYTSGAEAAVGGGTMPAHLVLTATDKAGVVTRYAYTSSGDLARVEAQSGLVTKYTYDEIGRAKTHTEISDGVPNGATTGYGYDDWSNLTSTTGPVTTNAVNGAQQQLRTDHSYDLDGNRTKDQVVDKIAGGEPRTTAYLYDEHNRVEKVTDAYDHETVYDYDRFGNVTSMVDAVDNRYEYAYTARNMIAQIRLRDFDGDPSGAPDTGDALVLRAFVYDNTGRLVRDTDAMGRQVEFAYYGDDLPKSATLKGFRNPDGTKRDIVLSQTDYDGAGNPVKQVTGNGRNVVQHVIDKVGRTESTTYDPGGLNRNTSYLYDPAGKVKRVTNSGAASNVPWPTTNAAETVDYGYDRNGRLTSETVTDGTTSLRTGYGYDQRDLLTSRIDPRGNVAGADRAAYTTNFTYDDLGRLTKTTAPPVAVERDGAQPATARPETVFGYNAFGERTETRDPLGHVNRTEHDRLGQPVKTVAPAYTPPGSSQALTPTTVTHYDPLGRPVKIVDPRGNDVRYSYDRLGRVQVRDVPAKTNDDRVQWNYDYTRTGEVLAVVDPNGARTEATYDDLGRTVTSTEVERRPVPASFTGRYSYDDADNLLTSSTPSGATTTNTYDKVNALIRTVDPAGVATQYGYDGQGRRVRVADAMGRTARRSYNPLGQLAGESDLKPDGTEIRKRGYAYDPAGNQTEITDALKRKTVFDYDALDRLTEQVEPVGDNASITTTFGYDAAGNRTRFTDGRRNSTLYTTNSLGLPESVTEPVTSAHPNLADRRWTTGYDEAGNPVTLTAPGGVVRERTFDANGRLLTESGSGAKAPTKERMLGYDPAGRLIKTSSGSGTNVYGYNDRGLLLSAEGPSGEASWEYNNDGDPITRTDAAGTSTFGYDKGRLQTVRDGITATTRTFGYNIAGQVSRLDYGSGRIRSIGYDDLGRTTTDTLKNSTEATVASVTYGYDDNDLTRSKTTTGLAGAGQNTYDYDHAGRLTSWTANGSTTNYTWDDAGNRTTAGNTTATFDERNRRLTDGGESYSYTPRGTVETRSTGGSSRSLTFDAFDRLAQDGPVAYTYDGLDRLSARNDRSFAYAGLEKDPVSDGGARYGRGGNGQLMSIERGGDKSFTLSDVRGDVVGSFNAGSELGSITDSTAYDPFGRITGSHGARSQVGYQGDWTDPETGQVNMAARWYDPAAGAFSSRDDMTLSSVPSSVNANRFTYANANPLGNTDPSGHWVVPLLAGGAAAARVGWHGYRAWRAYQAAKGLNDAWNRGRNGGGGGGGNLWWPWSRSSTSCTAIICVGSRGGASGGLGGGGRYWYGPSGSGYGGGGGGLSPAQLAAIARALAIARARARTAAAKKRAERDARTKARAIAPNLRRLNYADPASNISTGAGRPAAATAGTKNVVKDTTQALLNIRNRAVQATGPIIQDISRVEVTDPSPEAYPEVSGNAPITPGNGVLTPRPSGQPQARFALLDDSSRPESGTSTGPGASPRSDLEDRKEDCMEGKGPVNAPNYWSLDTSVGVPGRARGVDVCLTSIAGVPTNPRIFPMGLLPGYERGHLLASNLGGSNTDPRNFVPLTPSANSAMSHGVEKDIANRLRSGERLFYIVSPDYLNKKNHIPKKLDTSWWSSTGEESHQPWWNVR